MQDVLSNFDPGLDDLRKKKMLILGSTGLIASTFIEKVCALNDRYGLDLGLTVTYRSLEKIKRRLSGLETSAAVEFVEYDVRDPIPDGLEVDIIVHSASPAHPKAFVEDPVGVMDANLEGVRNTLEYIRMHPGTRLVYLSSGEIYGAKTANRPYSETDLGLVDPLNFRSCYPESKRAAETYIRCYVHQFGVDAVIARPGHVYGPALMRESTRVDVQFMNNALRGEDILMKSEGLQRRSYIHVDDVVTGLLVMILKGESGEAYNMSNRDSDITIRDYAGMLADIAGVKVVLELDPGACRGSSSVVDSTLDSTKLESLGWRPVIGMREGLESTYAFLRGERE